MSTAGQVRLSFHRSLSLKRKHEKIQKERKNSSNLFSSSNIFSSQPCDLHTHTHTHRLLNARLPWHGVPRSLSVRSFSSSFYSSHETLLDSCGMHKLSSLLFTAIEDIEVAPPKVSFFFFFFSFFSFLFGN